MLCIVAVYQVMGDSDHEDEEILVEFEEDVDGDDAFVTVVPRPLSSTNAATVSVSASTATASLEDDDDDWEVIDYKSVPTPQVARAASGALPHNSSEVVASDEARVVVDWLAVKLRAGAQWVWPWVAPLCARVQILWPDFEQMINRTSNFDLWCELDGQLFSGTCKCEKGAGGRC
jgi:hypothetical protein